MSEQEHLFISDVHLGAFSSEKETEVADKLIALIDYAIKQNAGLYILGDLFDYWMEYPDSKFVPDLGKSVLDKFEEYNRSVQPAIYVTGNHDNWTFGHFIDRGFDVEPKYRIIPVGKYQTLIMHGDGQVGDRNDFLRPAFHKLLRNPSFTQYYQKIFPPEIGVGIMKSFSNITRKKNHSNPDPLNNHAKSILTSNKVDVVLCGHDHLPRVETFSGGRYINLGAFFNDNTIVRYINSEFRLVTWRADTKEFVPYSSNNSQA
ncbi:MAG: UDP-2,3-diacylglucosamine diphosphatase [Balneolaceae bacterium]|nr:UDP-2,3-diacylglucosamine diphosphatase [Balneolaceae bacterium]MBO6546552.1 UDP-2,3-diacylglucosamine diphosphatase [Balneolaceae bacterium]MBO6648911.1 UDP-2,3-diacylglucosamine diphosphatase [Balneolaceae bacterium]